MLLNTDVEVSKNWIAPVLDQLKADKSIKAAQPKILDFKAKHKFEYAGASGGYIDSLAYPFCRGRIFQTIEKDNKQYDDSQDIFWASGSCLFIHRETYLELGGLDEDFFAHMEEIDLCWRIQRMGYKVMVQPGSEVFHLGGGTLAEGSDRKYFLNFRNNLYLIAKNHSSPFWFVLILWRMILDGISAFKFLVGGQASLFAVVIKAHFAFWGSFGLVLKKRKAVKKLGDTPVTLYSKSIVWQYFAAGNKKFSELRNAV